jgi:metacaspase-1
MTTERRGIGVAIGLNAVDPVHYRGWSGPLRACEADAAALVQIGRSRGFEMTELLTRAASRDAVFAALERAARELAAGDMFLLSYSGHGGQVPDCNGDEDDYQDETWCLYDGQLIDDELYLWFSKFAAGVRVLVFSDSCHSGTVTRQYGTVLAAGATHATSDPAAVFRAMPDDVAIRTYKEHQAFYDDLQRAIPADITAQLRATVRLISACQDNQFASDGLINSLFTGALLRVWNGGQFDGTYREFHRAIVNLMPPTQTPNHLVIGPPSPSFDAEKPFTL